ncbi:GntR family transcriptional regulator [Ileibacterium valens]|uniref:GntR family transcriptional regulator n=1 Tax=Ileibacterium valens TaxID=1862668 RepID=UPI00272B507E|nr:GntR family transcriptional regulator [Ileibacterium valens]
MDFQFNNEQPIWLQIAATIEQAIYTEEFEAGQKLPSVREIALLSRTNPNTVSKALIELEHKGLIETRRTAGKFVSSDLKKQRENRTMKAKQNAYSYLEAQKALGLDDKEAINLIESIIHDTNTND